VAGLPDPRAAAEAIRAQLAEGLGLPVEIDVMDPRELAKAAAEGTIDGLYLSGIGSSLADPSAFLGPVFGGGTSLPATRTDGVREALREAAVTADAATREAAFARANDQVRDAAAVVPLVSPGSVVAVRSDVGGVVTSPLGADPLGAFTPGDRRQLVFMQAAEPAGAWCGDQRSADALRLCSLVTDPLYGFAPGSLRPEPSVADRCTPNKDATTWTCRLRDGVTFHDGAALDAGDVLATYQAQWDAASPLRASRPDARFAWDALFGAPLAAPVVEPSPTP
jgi:ABC-type transport system substrate-binding protein